MAKRTKIIHPKTGKAMYVRVYGCHLDSTIQEAANKAFAMTGLVTSAKIQLVLDTATLTK